MKRIVLLLTALLVAGCGEKSSDSVTLPLSDANVERLLKEAVDWDSIEDRNGLSYQPNESKPFSGWAKSMYDSGQVEFLGQFKNGKHDGPYMSWYENGQRLLEIHWRNGKLVSASVWKPDGKPCPITKIVDGSGIVARWDENGQKKLELHFKKNSLAEIREF